MLSDPDYSAMLFISLRLASFSYRVAYLLIIILMDVYNTLYIVRVRHVLLEWSESDYYCTYVQPQMHKNYSVLIRKRIKSVFPT